MQVTDIATGRFVFSPRANEPVVYGELEKAITGAGYEIEKSWIEVAGKLISSESQVHIEIPEAGQRFHLVQNAQLEGLRSKVGTDARVKVTGPWFERQGIQWVEVKKWSIQAGN